MKRRIIPLLVLLSLTLGLLAACSSASTKPVESGRSQAGSTSQESGGKDTSSGSYAPNTPGQTVGPIDRMIIYTANMNIVVKNVSQTVDAVTDIVRTAGGFVAGTKIQGDASQKDVESQTAYLTLSIPATKYQDVMASLRKLSIKAPEENSSTQDVTEEYSDLQAQLRNLQVVEAQYQELMKKAVTIDDILKVQAKLSDTQSQIERIKGRSIYLERRSDMATINLNIRPEIPGKDTKPQGWDPLGVASEAWDASLYFLQAVATVVITVGIFFWWTVPLIILAIVLWRTMRGRRNPAVTPGA